MDAKHNAGESVQPEKLSTGYKDKNGRPIRINDRVLLGDMTGVVKPFVGGEVVVMFYDFIHEGGASVTVLSQEFGNMVEVIDGQI